MSQQGMTIVSLGGVEDVGDLEFIQTKVLAGDYFQVSGQIDAVTNTISYTVPSLRTAFMIEAKIFINDQSNIQSQAGSSGSQTYKQLARAALKMNGVKKDEAQIGYNTITRTDQASFVNVVGHGLGIGFYGDGRFNVLGLSLVGDGAKTITIENIEDNANEVHATMSGYLV